MKFLLPLSLVLISLHASANNYAGYFSKPHDLGFMNYKSKRACQKDKGQWNNGICVFHTADSVEVKPTSDAFKYSIDIATITTNAHTCSYTGEALRIADNTLYSETPTQEYKVDPVTGKGEMVPSICKVTLTYSDRDTVTVTTNSYNACSNFCGANAMLDIEKAERLPSFSCYEQNTQKKILTIYADENYKNSRLEYKVNRTELLTKNGSVSFPTEHTLLVQDRFGDGWEQSLLAYDPDNQTKLTFTGNTGSPRSDLALGQLTYTKKGVREVTDVECGYGLY